MKNIIPFGRADGAICNLQYTVQYMDLLFPVLEIQYMFLPVLPSALSPRRSFCCQDESSGSLNPMVPWLCSSTLSSARKRDCLVMLASVLNMCRGVKLGVQFNYSTIS
jgi:hypothetical protein